MIDGLSAVFWGVVTFSLLVVIHEGGHFLAARAFGVKVHEFMVGLPGPALRIKAKKTTYGITAIPLGGYVRIAGMEPGPEDPNLGPVLAEATRQGVSNAFSIAEKTGLSESDADAALITLQDWGALEQLPHDRESYRSLHEPSAADDPLALLDRARSITYRALSTTKRIVLLSAGVVLNLLTAVLVFTVVLSMFGYLKDTGTVGHVNP
ncbi:MAG: peptidase M50, partial [Actinobacteria bacterium]